MMKNIFRLGTRGSPLALIQAKIVRDALIKFHKKLAEDAIEIVSLRTSGDWQSEQREQTFLDMGGNKGLFTKEIEEALLDGSIDFAVHSMKDMPAVAPKNLDFAVMLERADPRDAFLSSKAPTLEELPPGATVGTSSLRRQAQVLANRPDVRVVPLRGNVDTRLRKLNEGAADATILAVAGLRRLGKEECIASIMEVQKMLPCAGQGALGVQCRSDNDELREWLKPINSATTMACVTSERAVLKVLDGSCRTPVAALAEIGADGKMVLDALVAKPDGTFVLRLKITGSPQNAQQLGEDLGRELKACLPSGLCSV